METVSRSKTLVNQMVTFQCQMSIKVRSVEEKQLSRELSWVAAFGMYVQWPSV